MSSLDLGSQLHGTGRYTRAVGTQVTAAELGTVELAFDRCEDLLQLSGFFHGANDHAASGGRHRRDARS